MGIDETLLANSAGARDADARKGRRLQPCLGLELRINLSGTMAVLVAVGEFVWVGTGFAMRRRPDGKMAERTQAEKHNSFNASASGGQPRPKMPERQNEPIRRNAK